jgi:hypothetical protein
MGYTLKIFLLAGCQNIWCYTGNFPGICVAQFTNCDMHNVKAFQLSEISGFMTTGMSFGMGGQLLGL